jgi:hypothetical protein
VFGNHGVKRGALYTIAWCIEELDYVSVWKRIAYHRGADVEGEGIACCGKRARRPKYNQELIT